MRAFSNRPTTIFAAQLLVVSSLFFSVYADEPKLGSRPEAIVTTQLLTDSGLAGDIGFYRFTITNHSGKESPFLSLLRLVPTTTFPLATQVNGEIGRLSKNLTKERVSNGMLPDPPRLLTGESWSFIGMYHIPFFHEETIKPKHLRFQIEVPSENRHSDSQIHQLTVGDTLCDTALARKIFESDDMGEPIISFNRFSLSEYSASAVRDLIPQLPPRSNVRQLFEFIIDGNRIIAFNDVDERQAKALLQARAMRLNPGPREYIIQMLPEIVTAALREKYHREKNRNPQRNPGLSKKRTNGRSESA